jgi:hypothetical protein
MWRNNWENNFVGHFPSTSINKSFLLWLGLFVFLAPSRLSAQETRQNFADKTGLPSLGAIKDCLKESRSTECLDNLFREAFKNHTTAEALRLIQRFEAEDPELRRDCHPVVHAVGRETFQLKGNIHDSFSACDQTCHSGCYHGSVERFLRGDDIYSETYKHPSQAELKQKATAACDGNTPLRFRYQCLHGLGHAILFFSAYQLQASLDICDAFGDDWSRSSCYGGVFMENVSNATNEKKNFSPTDYHAPCNQLADQYRQECYIMQTSRMMEMGLSTERMLEECAKAGAYQVPCTQSIGRDLSNEARIGQPRPVAQKCELVQDRSRLACIHGVVYALVDNTWDGRYALPFCAALVSYSDREDCFEASIQYLRTFFEKPIDDIARDCSRHAAHSPRCAELAVRQQTSGL